MSEPRRRTVAVLIFPGVELLDFAGPFEVFSSVRASGGTRERLLDVFTVAENMAPVACNNPLTVLPKYTLATMPHADILVIPGGQGTRTAIDRPELIAWIAARAAAAELTTSVCTGSFLLAKGGLLDGKAVTTHWASIERMRTDFPGLEVREATRWVDAGDVVSSAGVSAGIDMALYVVARLYGADVAAETARNIEYDYWE
ncbi:MAG: DJ-1/PfpI family protein [Caldilineaceae bacterium]|nr:DJ-1/PfpI family protein [Caldilineaceae bacterium]